MKKIVAGKSGWRRSLVPAWVLSFLTVLCACGDGTVGASNESEEWEILALGDSALQWNGAESTPVQVGERLSAKGISNRVLNRSVGGATTGCGSNGVGDAGNCVPPQYESGSWKYVLLSGGANDILDSACMLKADVLLSDDLSSGLTLDLIRQSTVDGARVLLYGYFLPLDAASPEANCMAVTTLLEGYKRLSILREDVTYIDAGLAVTRSNLGFYADNIHPSPLGSRVIADLIVGTLLLG